MPKILNSNLSHLRLEFLTKGVLHECSGYMSPEYAMEGQISEKSDVFSFGVLLLEVVSGKRNNYFLDEDLALNLLGYVSTYAILLFF